MDFIRSVITQDESISASDVKTYDLPINPLSHVNVVLKALNVTDEATLAEILARLSKVEILYKGSAIFSMSGADLYALDCALLDGRPILANRIATDNATRYITLVVPFGRKLMDPKECFPTTKDGELKIQLTFSGTETAADGVILQIEATEMIGATPAQYMKITTLSKTPAATGELDVDLPIGNILAGILLYGTTIVATTAWTNTIEYIKLLFNNVEKGYAKANWEALSGDMFIHAGSDAYPAAAAGDTDIAHYGLVDFSIYGGDDFLLDTAPASSVKLRVYAGDTNALRALPLELVKV